ncbi:hypothetical protein IV203_022058 [Nitzschia inconspicua]|uniref:Uncharacterized protein n=1 Tax=Nitzschia inconspicua TaxID=303405 RepID=A0A9K3PEE4_9STRA|nr:hypothetical protein IV203_022058 [Nitzschia inconspicua]
MLRFLTKLDAAVNEPNLLISVPFSTYSHIMQSSGAHARQMDADFDDNSMANNDGLGVHPHHFNSAEAQTCEAQAQQQPTRPNVGTQTERS